MSLRSMPFSTWHLFTGELAAARMCRRGCTAPTSFATFSAERIRFIRRLQRFKQEGRGVIVFLRDGAAGVPMKRIPDSGSTGSEFARSRHGGKLVLVLRSSKTSASPPSGS